MDAKDCLDLISNKIKELQRLRIRKQAELDSLNQQIDDLDTLAFTIEKNIAQDNFKNDDDYHP